MLCLLYCSVKTPINQEHISEASKTISYKKAKSLYTPQNVKFLSSFSIDAFLKKDSINHDSPNTKEIFTVYLNLKDQLLDYEYYNGLESTIKPYNESSHCRYYFKWNNVGDIDNNGLEDYVATMQYGILHGEISNEQCKQGAPPLPKKYTVHGMHVLWDILFLRFDNQAYPVFVLNKDVEFLQGGPKTIYRGPLKFCHGPKFFIFDKNLLDNDDVWQEDPMTKIMYIENKTINRIELNTDAKLIYNKNLKCFDITPETIN